MVSRPFASRPRRVGFRRLWAAPATERKVDVTASLLTTNDRDTLRRLAARVRAIADSSENARRRRAWTALNDLCHAGPPLLLVSPEGAWREILAGLPVECETELGRRWEARLRQVLYRHDVIRDDSAFEAVFTVDGWLTIGDFGIPFQRSLSSQAEGAYHDEPVLTDLERDLDKLTFRSLHLDQAALARELDLAREVVGDWLVVRPPPIHWWTCGLSATAIRLLGLEAFMLAMYDQPDGLRRLMRFLSDDMLNLIETCEREGWLRHFSGSDLVGSGNLGYTTAAPLREAAGDGPARLSGLWGFAESQETVGVSPAMFGEFIFPYQLPLLEKFGINYYGCCEACEGRWDWLARIPRLRCLSVAPWSDQARCAELLGRRYVYCRKPNPAPVCMGFNEADIRAEFRATLRHAGALNTVMVLKDTHTVENAPDRFARWVALGRAEFSRAAGG